MPTTSPRSWGSRRLIAPRAAGVASALGLLIAPARVDRVATVAREMEHVVWPELEAMFVRLEGEAGAVLAATLPGRTEAAIERLADIRYVGQASELVVPLPAGPYTAASRGALMQAFEASYRASFTRTPPTSQVEIINVRVSASLDVEGGAMPLEAERSRGASPVKRTRPAYFPELRDFCPTTVYDRYALTAGQAFDGPAIVEERESTLVVGPGGRFEVLASGNILVTIG